MKIIMKRNVILILCLHMLLFLVLGCSSTQSQQTTPGSAQGSKTPVSTENPTQTSNETSTETQNINSGSGSGVNKIKNNDDTSSNPEPIFDSEAVISKLSVKDYQYKNPYGDYYVWLAVTNNSDTEAAINGDMDFYDSNGNLIGTGSSSIEVLDPGATSILSFNNDAQFDKYEYKLKASESDYYSGVLSNLSVDIKPLDEKAIISVTNNGKTPAQFVEYTVLFLKGDDVVYYDWGYCVDDNSEIKPGETQKKEANYYNSDEDYDNVIVFLNGRAEKN